MMILDDLIRLPAEQKRIADSIKRTIAWARESLEYHATRRESHLSNNIFAIIQGGVDLEARKICTFSGYGMRRSGI